MGGHEGGGGGFDVLHIARFQGGWYAGDVADDDFGGGFPGEDALEGGDRGQVSLNHILESRTWLMTDSRRLRLR